MTFRVDETIALKSQPLLCLRGARQTPLTAPEYALRAQRQVESQDQALRHFLAESSRETSE